MFKFQFLMLGCLYLAAVHTGATPIQANRRIYESEQTIRDQFVNPQPVCPSTPIGRDESGNCPFNCTTRFQCLTTELCCLNACGNMSCTPIPQLRTTCRDIVCTRQGSVCVEGEETARCECAEECPRLTNTTLFCASDRFSYMSRCQMDKAACLAGTTVYQVDCPLFTTPSVALATSRTHTKPIAFGSHKRLVVDEGSNVTFRCQVSAYPRPRFYWQARGQRVIIRAGERIGRLSMPQSGGGSLFLQHVRVSDEGLYVCEATNYRGYVLIKFNLIVRVHQWVNTSSVTGHTFQQLCLQSPTQQNANCFDSPTDLIYKRIWFYNRNTENCERNSFRVCSSLINKYRTRQECENTCRSRCALPLQRGNCFQFTQRLFYNSISGNCEPFVYSGCGGNGNNFRNIEDCRNNCPVPRNPGEPVDPCPLCRKNIVMGYCKAVFVFVAQILEVIHVPNEDSHLTLRLIRVVKDERFGFNHLDLTHPVDKSIVMSTNVTCPCPNVVDMMHRPVRSGIITRASQCSAQDRRNNRHCGEVIISGSVLNGAPIVPQGSLGVPATRKNIAKLEGASEDVCGFIRNQLETQNE